MLYVVERTAHSFPATTRNGNVTLSGFDKLEAIPCHAMPWYFTTRFGIPSSLHKVLAGIGTRTCFPSRRLVLQGYFGLTANDKHVEESTSEEGNSGNIVEDQHPGVHSEPKAQKGDKDEVQALPAESVHESKVLAQGVIDARDGGPPHEFVDKQHDRKEDHVKGQKWFAQVVGLNSVSAAATVVGAVVVGRFLVDPSAADGNLGENTESGHQDRESHVQDAEQAQEPPAVSAGRSLAVLAVKSGFDDDLMFVCYLMVSLDWIGLHCIKLN
jgi:hypothetical protein